MTTQTDEVQRWITTERQRRTSMHEQRRGPLGGVRRTERVRDGVRCVEYLPQEQPVGRVLWLHGGGWVFGEPEGDEGMLATWCRDARCAITAVDYSLAPEHPYPAALDDSSAAFEHLHSESSETPVVVAGASAGATLAAGLCLRQRDRGRPLPLAQVLICPPLESNNTEEDTGPLTRDAMQQFWHLWSGPGGFDEYARPGEAQDLTRLPPAHIFTTSSDPLRLEGWRYATRLAAAGVDVSARFTHGGHHGFEYEDPDSAFSRRAVQGWAAVLREMFTTHDT